jgi:hypothetical protein
MGVTRFDKAYISNPEYERQAAEQELKSDLVPSFVAPPIEQLARLGEVKRAEDDKNFELSGKVQGALASLQGATGDAPRIKELQSKYSERLNKSLEKYKNDEFGFRELRRDLMGVVGEMSQDKDIQTAAQNYKLQEEHQKEVRELQKNNEYNGALDFSNFAVEAKSGEPLSKRNYSIVKNVASDVLFKPFTDAATEISNHLSTYEKERFKGAMSETDKHTLDKENFARLHSAMVGLVDSSTRDPNFLRQLAAKGFDISKLNTKEEKENLAKYFTALNYNKLPRQESSTLSFDSGIWGAMKEQSENLAPVENVTPDNVGATTFGDIPNENKNSPEYKDPDNKQNTYGKIAEFNRSITGQSFGNSAGYNYTPTSKSTQKLSAERKAQIKKDNETVALGNHIPANTLITGAEYTVGTNNNRTEANNLSKFLNTQLHRNSVTSVKIITDSNGNTKSITPEEESQVLGLLSNAYDSKEGDKYREDGTAGAIKFKIASHNKNGNFAITRTLTTPDGKTYEVTQKMPSSYKNKIQDLEALQEDFQKTLAREPQAKNNRLLLGINGSGLPEFTMNKTIDRIEVNGGKVNHNIVNFGFRPKEGVKLTEKERKELFDFQEKISDDYNKNKNKIRDNLNNKTNTTSSPDNKGSYAGYILFRLKSINPELLNKVSIYDGEMPYEDAATSRLSQIFSTVKK